MNEKLTTADFLSHLRDMGVELWVDEDKLRFNAPNDMIISSLREELTQRKIEIIRFLVKSASSIDSATIPLQAVSRDQDLPLSFAQERLWFLHHLEPDSTAYSLLHSIRLQGVLRKDALEKTYVELARRHETLRTTFHSISGNPLQRIAVEPNIVFDTIDLRHLPEVEREAEVKRLSKEDARKPFDLKRGPLFRIRLFQIEDEEHVLHFNMHHIISDFWSFGVMAREIAALYTAFIKGKPADLPELSVQYADYAVWQRQWLQGEVLEAQLTYWKDKLGGELPVLELPTDRPRPAVQTHRGAMESLTLPKELTEALQAMSRREGVTVFMTLLAAFKTLLYRLTGQEDTIVGTAIAGRNRAELEGLIGFFINTIVMRTDLAGNPTFRELLGRVRETALGAYAHQDMPFERLVEELAPERNLSRPPLFQVFFNHMVARGDKALQLPGLESEAAGELDQESKFDMTLHVVEGRGGITLRSRYNTDLFDSWRMAQMLKQYQMLLESIVSDPDQRIGEFALMCEKEREEVINIGYGPKSKYPKDQCFQEVFARQVIRNSQAVAVVFEDQSLTYQELNTRANQLAHYLQRHGVGPEVRVGLCLNRSIEMIVAVLGIFKAGGAYVPMDPNYPQKRLAFMAKDTDLRVILTQEEFQKRLSHLGGKHIHLDADWPVIGKEMKSNPVSQASADSLAYVLFTSGSTGRPKGVEIEHRQVLNYVDGILQQLNLPAGSSFAMVSPITADLGNTMLYPALATGGTLHIISEDRATDSVALGAYFQHHQPDSLKIVPSHLASLMMGPAPAEVLPQKRLVVGGEACPGQLVEKVQALKPGCRVINHYGPTETTVGVTTHQVEATDRTTHHSPSVPIGRPLPNSQLYILDSHQNLVPIGVAGELYIGGRGVARGYAGTPELTADKFVPHPYSEKPGTRLYKTGDRAKFQPDGTIEFLGRIDHQVKIRGFRIELGEVEATLCLHPSVSEAVVIAREDQPGKKRLVAYVVSNRKAHPTFSELRSFLTEKLPDHMIPTAFGYLECLPLMPNGKVDRRALPASDVVRPDLQEAFVAPRTPTEEMVAGIWCNVLGLERIGVYDSFFVLGGHSLLVIQIVSRIREVFEVELPVRALFEAPTVAGLTERIETARRSDEGLKTSPLQAVSRDQDLPLSFAQERFWVLDQIHINRAIFNSVSGFRLRGSFQLAVFRESVQALVDRHEILRTTFASVDGEPHQVIAPTLSVAVPLQNCSGLSKEERAGMIQQVFLEERRFQFDLAHGPLFRARLLQFAEDDHFLVLNLHHIIHDAWSLEVIIKDLVTAYTAGCAGHAVTLPALPIQYVDYAHWQRELLQGPIGREQLAFWKTQLAQLPPALPLPTDYARPAVQTFRGARVSLQLSAELLTPLRALNRQEGTTLFMVLLATLQFLLHRLTGTHDILVGSPIAGRDRQELHGLIGCFLNTLVLRTDLSGDLTGRDLLQRVREVVLNAYENQDVPFEKILAEVDPARDLSRTPIFQVMLNMHSFDDQSLPLPGLSVTRVGLTDVKSLFDMTLYFNESTDEIRLYLVYNFDLFTAGRMTEFMRQFQSILEQLANDPDRPLEEFTLVTPTALLYLPDPQQSLDAEWGGPVWSRLGHHAHQQGEAIAMVSPGGTWTYQELEFRSNQFAHCLLEQGVKAQEVVAIYAARSPELVLALLGILKAGAAFMILDPSYPSTRLLEMLQIAKPCGFIHLEEAGPLPDEVDAWAARVPCCVRLPAFAAAETDFEELLGSTLKTAPEVKVQPDDVAYVTFTSGSTGTPKCLQGTHRPLSHFMRWYTQTLQLTAADSVTMFSGLAHDPLLRDVFTPLWIGGTLCIPDQEVLTSGRVGDWMYEQKITLMHLTPPLVDVLTVGRETSQVSCTSLRYAVFGGESLRPVHLDCVKQLAPQATCVNGYGATETPQIMCWYVVSPEFPSNREQVPIGQGIDGVQILVLNNTGQLAGIGELGEIYIRTPYLTLGYMNDEALTSARFLQNPFRPEAGDRIYRTGDMGRLLPDGSIEFAGRRDHQVKVRGFRIELGEIESQIKGLAAVSNCVVVLREDRPGDQRLTAYYVCKDGHTVSESDMRRQLQAQLPEYMVPQHIMQLPSMPLTPNGKVDRQALPKPQAGGAAEQSYVAPRNEAEQKIAAVWQEVLNRERVGVNDNFFELGGHSLLATQVTSRINKLFNIQLPLRRLFEAKTIEALAEVINISLWNTQGLQGPGTTGSETREVIEF